MKKWLSQNIALKVISLLLAFLIWLMVVNISQPEVSGAQTLEIEVRNADLMTSADKIYSTDTRTVRVSYRVRLPQLNRIRAEDFSAYVDLADYSITGAVPIYVSVSEDVEDLISDVTLSPMVMHVDTEDIQRKRFEVTASTKGRTADGFMAGEFALSPSQVYVTGPISEVGQISSVGIEVNVSEANSTQSGTAELLFYDANGNEIEADERITLNKTDIAFELPIYRIKSLSIIAQAEGTPADGYVLESVESSPGFVDVYGEEDILDQYASLTLPSSVISVNGASATVSASVDVTEYLPDGLKLAQPGTEVTVAARIRKLPEPTTPPEEDLESSVSEVEITEETAAEQTAEQTEASHAAGSGESAAETFSESASLNEETEASSEQASAGDTEGEGQ